MFLYISGGRVYCEISRVGPDIVEDWTESDLLQDRHPGGAGGAGWREGSLHFHAVPGPLPSLPVEEQTQRYGGECASRAKILSSLTKTK